MSETPDVKVDGGEAAETVTTEGQGAAVVDGPPAGGTPAIEAPADAAVDAGMEAATGAAYDAGFASGLATGRAEVREAVREAPRAGLPQAEPVGYCAGSFYLDLSPARALTLARLQAGLLQQERVALPANEVIGRILDFLAE